MVDGDLNKLFPPFREKVEMILAEMLQYSKIHCPNLFWSVHQGFRTAKYQHLLYKKGRRNVPGESIVTNLDGYIKVSSHQTSLAVDIVPKIGGKSWTWNIDNKHWDYLGHLFRKHGLVWLGDTTLRDRPHGEWPRKDKKTYQKAKEWQVQNGLSG